VLITISGTFQKELAHWEHVSLHASTEILRASARFRSGFLNALAHMDAHGLLQPMAARGTARMDDGDLAFNAIKLLPFQIHVDSRTTILLLLVRSQGQAEQGRRSSTLLPSTFKWRKDVNLFAKFPGALETALRLHNLPGFRPFVSDSKKESSRSEHQEAQGSRSSKSSSPSSSSPPGASALSPQPSAGKLSLPWSPRAKHKSEHRDKSGVAMGDQWSQSGSPALQSPLSPRNTRASTFQHHSGGAAIPGSGPTGIQGIARKFYNFSKRGSSGNLGSVKGGGDIGTSSADKPAAAADPMQMAEPAPKGAATGNSGAGHQHGSGGSTSVIKGNSSWALKMWAGLSSVHAPGLYVAIFCMFVDSNSMPMVLVPKMRPGSLPYAWIQEEWKITAEEELSVKTRGQQGAEAFWGRINRVFEEDLGPMIGLAKGAPIHVLRLPNQDPSASIDGGTGGSTMGSMSSLAAGGNLAAGTIGFSWDGYVVDPDEGTEVLFPLSCAIPGQKSVAVVGMCSGSDIAAIPDGMLCIPIAAFELLFHDKVDPHWAAVYRSRMMALDRMKAFYSTKRSLNVAPATVVPSCVASSSHLRSKSSQQTLGHGGASVAGSYRSGMSSRRHNASTASDADMGVHAGSASGLAAASSASSVINSYMNLSLASNESCHDSDEDNPFSARYRVSSPSKQDRNFNDRMEAQSRITKEMWKTKSWTFQTMLGLAAFNKNAATRS
jgi:hypothetical protein